MIRSLSATTSSSSSAESSSTRRNGLRPRRSRPRCGSRCRPRRSIRWSSSASPISRPAPAPRRREAAAATVEPRAAADRGRARRSSGSLRARDSLTRRRSLPPVCAATPRPEASSSHGRPSGRRPSAAIRQRPFIPRWLWTTSSPEKWASRCLPRASARSSGPALELAGAVVQRRARVRGVGELELASGERGVQPPGRDVDRVALGHAQPAAAPAAAAGARSRRR